MLNYCRKKLNSHIAFCDANQISNGKVNFVSEIGTRNSTWMCKIDSEISFVIKYFAEDEHGNKHFQAEKDFIELNKDQKFIPEILFFDDQRNWIATKYVATNLETRIDLKSIVDLVENQFQKLFLNFQAHEFPSGILESDSLTFEDSPLQTVLAYELKEFSWIDEFRSDVKKNWQKDSVVHGDIKLSNLAISKNSVTVFDWESVALGPREWDIAGLLQSVLSEAIGNRTYKNWAINNLEYCINRIIDLDDFTQKCFALRCIQNAFESLSGSNLIPHFAVNMIQTAEYVANKDIKRIKDILNYEF